MATKCNHQGFRVKLLHPDAQLPTRGSKRAAGYDLYAPTNGVIYSRTRKKIKLGIAADLPYGYYGKLRDRSGIANNYGVNVLAGTIDNDYRGEWSVLLQNNGQVDLEFKVGERIIQVVLMEYGSFPVIGVEELDGTERGEGGFGSTGA